MTVEWLAAAIRHNAERTVRYVVKQRAVRLRKMDDERGVIGSVHAFDQRVSCGFQRGKRAITDAVECPLHIARSERPSVVKMNPLAQMKNVSLGIRNLPFLRHPWLHVEMLVAMDQRIEKQFVNTF